MVLGTEGLQSQNCLESYLNWRLRMRAGSGWSCCTQLLWSKERTLRWVMSILRSMAYSTAIFFSLKKLSKKMLAWKRAIKIATCVFSPSFARNLALKIYLEFWIFIFVQKKKGLSHTSNPVKAFRFCLSR